MKLKEVINNFINWKIPQTSKSCKYNAYNCKWQLINFAIFLRNKDVEKVSEKDITEYLMWSEFFGHSAITRQKQAIAIKKLLEYCLMHRMKVENPLLVPHVKKERVLPQVATDEEYYKVLNVIPISGYNHIRNKCILALAADSGARIGELCSLDVDSLDIQNNRIIIKTEKAEIFRQAFFRKETVVYLTAWLKKRKEIMNHLNIEEEKALFISIIGGQDGYDISAKRSDVEAIEQAFRNYSKKAGLKRNCRPHSLRHRFGRQMAEKGIDEVLLPQFMGHRNIESSRIYTQLYGPKLKKIYDRVMGR